MNLEEYISSGILEIYVLGELSEKETAEVEVMKVRHPEVKAELDSIEKTIEMLAAKTSIKPRNDQGKIIKSQLSFYRENKIGEEAFSNKIYKYGLAASVLIALCLSWVAADYWSKWKDVKEELDRLRAENKRMSINIDVVNEKLGALKDEMTIITDADFNSVKLLATDEDSPLYVTVFWNQENSHVYIKTGQLRSLPEEHQFQLWALIDGKPHDLGVFDVSAALMQMKGTTKAEAFAVTIEPRGGSEKPTLSRMQVIGYTNG